MICHPHGAGLMLQKIHLQMMDTGFIPLIRYLRNLKYLGFLNLFLSPSLRSAGGSLNPSDLVVAQERILASLPEIYSPADWETYISNVIYETNERKYSCTLVSVPSSGWKEMPI